MALAPYATGTIAQALKGIDFPCGKTGLVDYARGRGADPDAVAVLEGLPEQNYESMAEVFHAVGGKRGRGRRAEPLAQQQTPPQSSPEPQPEAQSPSEPGGQSEEEEPLPDASEDSARLAGMGIPMPTELWGWWSDMIAAWGEFNRCLLAQWFPWLR